VKKLEGDKTLRKPRPRSENNIKMDLKRRKSGWSWALSQNMGKLFNTIMHFNKADLQLNKVDADSALLGYKAASLCNQFPVYRRIIVPSYSTSMNLYHPVTRRHITEEELLNHTTVKTSRLARKMFSCTLQNSARNTPRLATTVQTFLHKHKKSRLLLEICPLYTV